MAHADFDAARAADAENPDTFTLVGREWTLVAELPASAVFDLAAKEDAGGTEAYDALREFFHVAIVPEQVGDFDALIPAGEVGIRTLTQVARWIMEQQTARPFTPATPSLA